MLFVHNTSRVADEPYPTLLREKGFNAFPSVCFLGADGNVLVKQGERSVKGFTATLQRLPTWCSTHGEPALALPRTTSC